MGRPSRTILVIDDAPVDRETCARFLARDSRHHYEILAAETGRDGLDLLAEHEVDCVLLDLNLPDTDGLDMLDELRTSFCREIPVVMLTGAGSEAIAVETMKRGCQDYVAKSDFSSNVLLRAVDNAIERVKLREEIERKRADLEASQREQIELKNRFLSHVSHELRTPLTAVHQFLSLCLDGLAGELTEKQHEYLDIALRNANQLKRMINDLMDVARAEAGKLRVELAPVKIDSLVEESIRTLQSAAAAKGISLSAEPNHSLPTVLADESRIRQVLDNLIGNAIKFTPERGSVSVSAARERAADRDWVRIAVTDTGCGISEEGQKKVFSRLHQESSDNDDARKGLGLGLAICKELISLHGGRISVESANGTGSSFRFTLPVFTLARMLAPALVKKDRLRRSYGVLRVTLTAKNPRESQRISEEQSRRIHRLLGKLLYYPFDVVLPRLSKTEDIDVHYAVAATDADGMKSIVLRVREQLKSHIATKVPNGEVRVDGCVEEFGEQELEGSLELAVENAARRIEKMMWDPGVWSE